MSNPREQPEPSGADALLQARAALQQANARMENMLESLTDGFCAVDHDWRIMYVNARALEMLAPQTSRSGLIGRDLWEAFPELRGSHLETVYRDAMAQRATAIQEFFYPALKRWFEVRAHPSPDGLTLYFQDINRRKADQQALQQGSSRLQVALDAGGLGDWRWDAATDTVTLGERAAVIFGLAAEQPLSWDAVRARLDPADGETVREAVLNAFAGHSDLEVECRLPAAAVDGGANNGDTRWIALVGRTDYAEQARHGIAHGAVLGMTGVVQDVTARRFAADTLRQSEEVLRTLANTIPQLAWMAQADGAIVWFNERWFDYTGTTPDQVVGWGWQATCEPSVLPAVQARWLASIRNGDPFEMEYPIRGADDKYRWFLTRVNPVRDHLGKVQRWFGTNTDVDEVKRAEQALRDESHVLELLNSTGSAFASTRDLRSLLQTAADAATGIAGARQGAFLYLGKDAGGHVGSSGNLFSLYTVSGASPAGFEAFGEAGPNGLFGPGTPTEAGAVLLRSDDIAHDPRFRDQPPFGLPASHPAIRSYLSVPVVAHSGEVLGTLFFGHPEPAVFTERTERIVRGIAAQAAVAIDNARLYEAAQRAAEERKVLLESERQARAEAERTSQMKDEFLSTLSHELRTPLSAILGWAQVLRRGGRDQNDLQKGLQTIERNARAQAQLIEDLLDMSRITSGKVLLEMQTVTPTGFIDAAVDTVRPAADAKNIRIDKQYGTEALLVAGDPARLQQVVWNLLSNAIKFTPRDLSGIDVLVVDDDRDARELINRILGDCGATVRIAGSAREALVMFRETVPNLLISDLGMPEVDGFELLDWVRHLGRDEGGQVPAIALTAFARSEDRLLALEAGFSAHISKPVEPSELIATVAAVVGPAAPLVDRTAAPAFGRNGVR